MAHRIILDETGQTLRHVPMGVVSDASYIIEDLAYSIDDAANRVIASGTPTVASWSLTTSATAGPTQANGARISVTSTTGAEIGAPAVIVAPDGARELLEVGALSSESYIEADASLVGVYPSGSTVYGVLVSASVPDDFAANEDRFKLAHPLRVTWTYTLDGSTRRVPELIEWTRHNVAADASVGEAVLWLGKAYPSLREGLPDFGSLDDIAELMAEEIRHDVAARDIDPATLLVGDRARVLLVARILAHAGELGWAPGAGNQETWAESAAKRYADKLNSLTIGRPGHNTSETDPSTDTAITGSTSHINRSIFSRM